MSDRRDIHPVEDLFSRLAIDAEPTQADRDNARDALTEAIAAEGAPRRLQREVRWKRPVLAVGTVAVGLVIAIGVTQAPNPAPAQAALLEIARAAELVEPSSIPDQSYAYTYSETTALAFFPEDIVPGRDKRLTAIFSQVREAWHGDGVLQLRTTHLAPGFFSDEDETDFYAAGLDDISDIGETITETLDVSSFEEDVDWSNDPVELLQQIKDDIRGRVTQAKIVESAVTLLRETGASPALRASVLRVISDLSKVEILDQSPATTTFLIEFNHQGPFELEFVLDSNGQLLAERLRGLEGRPDLGVPPNILWEEITYHPTVVVDDLSTPLRVRS